MPNLAPVVAVAKPLTNLPTSGFNETLLSTLLLLSLGLKLNSTFKDQLSTHLLKEDKGGKYSKTNFENLQFYFDSLQDESKRGNKTLAVNNKVNYQSQDNSNNNNSDGDNSDDQDEDDNNGDLGRATKKPSGGYKRTTKRPRTTRASRKTTQRKTTTVPPSTTTPSSSSPKPADVVWILICGIIIFTMQTGFGLLEGGIVSQKNETNIMLKNVADVVLGGFSYWVFGYGITYGTWDGSVSFFGLGLYFVDESYPLMGDLFTSFFFQLSFATTATTIVSGAIAERMNFKAYCLYSFVATFTYSVQARWVWGPGGFLGELGAVDVAGSGCIHLVGGTSAFVAAWMVGPRLGRYNTNTGPPPMGNPNTALIGLLLLWWGWIAFNAGSVYGVTANRWQFAARAASTTMIASIGGGLVGIFWGFVKPGSKVFDAIDVINSVLGALVGITAGCALMHSVEAFFTGVIGAIVVLIAANIPDLLKVDDPVGATAVHGFGGLWGLLAVGVFAEDDFGVLGLTKGRYGLVRAGGWYLIGVQTLTAVCIIAWSIVSTFVFFFLINLIIPLRVSADDELVGLDFSEHGVRRKQVGMSPALSLFGSNPEIVEVNRGIVGFTGQNNPAHEKITQTLRELRHSKPKSKTKRIKFKNAAMLALAFKKLQAKGNRITPRDREYIFDEYSSPLKDSNENILDENKKNARIQTESTEEIQHQPAYEARTTEVQAKPETKATKLTFWQRMFRRKSKSVQTDEKFDTQNDYSNNVNAKSEPTTMDKAVSANPDWRRTRYYDDNKLGHNQLTYLP